MNTTKIMWTIVIVAAATLVLAPVLSITPVDAKKTSSCTTGSSSHECSGNSENTPAGHTSCSAGSKGENSPNCSGSK